MRPKCAVEQNVQLFDVMTQYSLSLTVIRYNFHKLNFFLSFADLFFAHIQNVLRVAASVVTKRVTLCDIF